MILYVVSDVVASDYSVSYLVAMSSRRDSGTEPFLTDLASSSPQKAPPSGITMSIPESVVATPACWAPQSDTTKPCNLLVALLEPSTKYEYLEA